jgi:crotonobetainyl-CoA:carnitine CoA-transferase CaiB-like acyl-CoA transferase
VVTGGDDEVEAEARRLLQAQITRSAWFRTGMAEKERRERIKQEVDTWWHLKTEEAKKLLEARAQPEPLKQAG